MKPYLLLSPTLFFLLVSSHAFSQCQFCFESYSRSDSVFISNTFFAAENPGEFSILNCFDDFDYAAKRKADIRRRAIQQNKSLQALKRKNECQLGSLPKGIQLAIFYESLGPTYPDSIADGWHWISAAYADGSISLPLRVKVQDNQIKEFNYRTNGYQQYVASAFSGKISEGHVKFQFQKDFLDAYFLEYIVDPTSSALPPKISPVGTWWDGLDADWKLILSGRKKAGKPKYAPDQPAFVPSTPLGHGLIGKSKLVFDTDSPTLADLSKIGNLSGLTLTKSFIWKAGDANKVLAKLPNIASLQIEPTLDTIYTIGILNEVPYPEKIMELHCFSPQLKFLKRFQNLKTLVLTDDKIALTSPFAGRSLTESFSMLGPLPYLESLTIQDKKFNEKWNLTGKKEKEQLIQQMRILFPKCKQLTMREKTIKVSITPN